MGEKMIVKIENKMLNSSYDMNHELVNFDVKNKCFFSVNKFLINQKTEIFEYKDFSILWCIVVKNNTQYVRFVLFNMQKQQSHVIFEVQTTNVFKLFRMAENIFILICDGKYSKLCTAVLSDGAITNNAMQFCKIKNVFKLNKNRILVHSKNRFYNEFFVVNLNSMQKQLVFNFLGEIRVKISDGEVIVFNDEKVLKIIK